MIGAPGAVAAILSLSTPPTDRITFTLLSCASATTSAKDAGSSQPWDKTPPADPGREDLLLPLTRYLRDRGKEVRAPELILAQAYLQFVVRGAWKILNDFDVVLTPTLAQPPVPVGWFDEVSPAENFERQKQFTPYTAMYNVTGQPAVNLPLYWAEGGLPIGVMVAGPMGGEGLLLSLSAQVEAARPWKDRHPALW